MWQDWQPRPSLAYRLFCHSEYVVRTASPRELRYSWQGAQTSEEVWTWEYTALCAGADTSLSGPLFSRERTTVVLGFPSVRVTSRREWQ
jgi:hypothetical protein